MSAPRALPPGGVERLLSGSRLSTTMPWILGVMLALATLATGAALSGALAALSLRDALSERLTVQVVEGDPARRSAVAVRALALLQGDRRVARAELVPDARVRELIAPYLGTEELDPELPVPALIDVTLAAGGRVAAERAAGRLAGRLAALSGAVRVDRSVEWARPVSRFLTLSAGLALTVLLLAVAATTAAVVLAARAALDAHGSTIATLHLLGATDAQVSRLFERRVARDGLAGVAVGYALGLALFALAADRTARLADGFSVAGAGGDGAGVAGVPTRWLVAAATALVPLGAMALTRLSTRWTVLAALRAMR